MVPARQPTSLLTALNVRTWNMLRSLSAAPACSGSCTAPTRQSTAAAKPRRESRTLDWLCSAIFVRSSVKRSSNAAPACSRSCSRASIGESGRRQTPRDWRGCYTTAANAGAGYKLNGARRSSTWSSLVLRCAGPLLSPGKACLLSRAEPRRQMRGLGYSSPGQ